MRFFFMARMAVAVGPVFARGMFMFVARMPRSVDVLMLVLMAMGVLVIVRVRMTVGNVPVAVDMVVFMVMLVHMLMGMRVFTFHFPILVIPYCHSLSKVYSFSLANSTRQLPSGTRAYYFIRKAP